MTALTCAPLRALALAVALTGACLLPGTARAAPQLPDFTYQGRLTQNGAPANGSFDLQFQLFTEAVGGVQVGPTLDEPDFPVSDGLFTVALAFPGAFAGEQRWLQVTVEGQVLLPRQAVSTAPVAQFALSGSVTGPAGGDLTGSYPNPVIAPSAVTSAQIANGTIGTVDLANGSVTLAKIAGGGNASAISGNLTAGLCASASFNVTNAQPGDLVLFSWGATAVVPTFLVGHGHRVETAGQAVVRLCNHGSTSISFSAPVVVRTMR